MRKKSILTLVVTLVLLLAFATSCFAATPKKAAVKKPVAAPAKTTVAPAKAAAPAVAVPAGLTGDKAKAYTLLAKSKYSNKATSNLTTALKDVPILGDLSINVKTTSTGNATKGSSEGMPTLSGGDFKDKTLPAIPWIEVAKGDTNGITTLLKQAKDVKVNGNTITISGGQAPTSIITILNAVSGKLHYSKTKISIDSLVIEVGSTGSVSAVKSFKLVGKNDSDMPAVVTGSATF